MGIRADIRAGIFARLQANTGAGLPLAASFDAPLDPLKADIRDFPIAAVYNVSKEAEWSDNADWKATYIWGVMVAVPMDPQLIGEAEKRIDDVVDALDADFAAHQTIGGVALGVRPVTTAPFEIKLMSKTLYCVGIMLSFEVLQPVSCDEH